MSDLLLASVNMKQTLEVSVCKLVERVIDVMLALPFTDGPLGLPGCCWFASLGIFFSFFFFVFISCVFL